MNLRNSLFTLVFLLCLSLFYPMGVSAAQSGFCNDNHTVTWSRSGSTLTIGGAGAMDADRMSSEDIDSTGITHIIIEDGVTEICYNAFSSFQQLESVEIPDSVKYIWDNAFWNCTALAEAELPANLEYLGSGAFSYCAIDHVTFGEKLTAIRSYTFSGCSNLTEIIIPDNITSVDEAAFQNCSNVTSITIGENVSYIGRKAFYDLTKLTSVHWNAIEVADFNNGNGVFRNAGEDTEGLSVVFGGSVRHIPRSCFFPEVDNFNILNNPYAPKLVSVHISPSVRTIGENAFCACLYLTDISIPDGVVSLGEGSFSEIAIETIHIPKSVSQIDRGAFHSNINLTEITVDAENKDYCSQDGVLFNKDMTVLVQHPIGNPRTSYTVPESVLYIGEESFMHCTNLINITLPSQLKQISNFAFYECNNLSGMTLPETVETIEVYAFFNCTNMTHLNLPEKVTVIPRYAFHGCESLTEFVIPNKVTEIGEAAFYNCNSLTELIIPDSVLTIGSSAFTYLQSATKIVLPKHLSRIEPYTFSYCYDLKEIVIPDEVTFIGLCAFDYCSDLITVTIPTSVTTIEDSAFRSTSLRNVLYKGTTTQWVTLANSKGDKNETLTTANKYYNYVDGTPIAGLYQYHNDTSVAGNFYWADTFVIDAINIEETSNAVVFLAVYDEEGRLLHLLPTDSFQKEVAHRTDTYYELTKGTAVAMIWDKGTLTPLAQKTTRSYDFTEKDDNFIDIEEGSSGGSGGDAGAEIGGVTAGGNSGSISGGVVSGTVTGEAVAETTP